MPRADAKPSNIIDRLNALVAEAESLLLNAVEYSVEDSHIRLSRVRALIDRSEGIRARVATIHRHVNAEALAADFANRVDFANAASSGSAQSSALEREAKYLLRSLGAAQTASQAQTAREHARLVERRVSDIYRALSDHRLEALTLLRASTRIAADEYDVVG